MGSQRIVGNLEGLRIRKLLSRSMNTSEMAKPDKALRLIQGDKILTDIRKILCNHFRILSEPPDHFLIQPAASVLQRLRKFPVIHGQIRSYAVFLHRQDHIPVHRHSFLIYTPCSFRHDPAPAYGKTVCLHPQKTHKLIVLFVTVHMVAGHRCILSIQSAALFRESIPDHPSGTILWISSFYLIGAAGNTPYKIISEHYFPPVESLIGFLYSFPPVTSQGTACGGVFDYALITETR